MSTRAPGGTLAEGTGSVLLAEGGLVFDCCVAGDNYSLGMRSSRVTIKGRFVAVSLLGMWFFAWAGLLLSGCVAPELSKDPEVSRKSLLKIIPIGTPISEARDKLKHLRYRFTGNQPQNDGLKFGGPSPIYLYCQREKTIGLLTQRQWSIGLFYENERLTDIIVKVRQANF